MGEAAWGLRIDLGGGMGMRSPPPALGLTPASLPGPPSLVQAPVLVSTRCHMYLDD
jgi:hypothetical protein